MSGDMGKRQRTITTQVCIPCTVRVSGSVNDDGELDLTAVEVVGESGLETTLIEHLSEEEYEHVCCLLEREQ